MVLQRRVTYYVLFIIELATRIVHIAGITTEPNEDGMMQLARGLTDEFSDLLIGKSHLVVDRDTKYTAQFPTAHCGGADCCDSPASPIA